MNVHEEARMASDERPARSHRDLPVWQQSMVLVETVYRLTSSFPESERIGLASQLRCAAVSIPSNIAEGSARSSTGELGQFLGAALGAVAQVETLLELAKRLQFVASTEEATLHLESVRKQLIVYRRSLRA
jgi:four helix bundle protein